MWFLGIAGKNSISDDLFYKSFNKLEHRGPNQSKIFKDEIVKLGFKRLKILDLSENGSQPMTSLDNSTTIVFNGEIYNFKSIKKF